MCTFEDNPLLPDINSFSTDVIVPTTGNLIDNYNTLAARIIPKHIPFFKENVSSVVRHIPYRYISQMSLKSDVVSIAYLLLLF
jgi:hypothetical protein